MYLGFPTYLYIEVVLKELLRAFVRQSICPNRFWGSFLVPRSQFSLKEQRRRQRGYGGGSMAVAAMVAAQSVTAVAAAAAAWQCGGRGVATVAA